MNNIPKINPASAAWVHEVAQRLSKSGPFDGASPAQLEAKIWIAVGLGVDPATACGAVTFSRGKPVFPAAFQGALLARSEKYGFEVMIVDDTKAEILFLRDGKELGISSFTIEEAKRAGLCRKEVWQSYPSDLLYARALTRGVRRYAPDLLAGSASYTLEEVGHDVHEAMPAKTEAPPTVNGEIERGTITAEQLAVLKACRQTLQIPHEDWIRIMTKRGVGTAMRLSKEQADELIGVLRTKVNVMRMQSQQLQEDAALAAQRNGDLVIDVSPVGKPANGKEVKEAAGSLSKS